MDARKQREELLRICIVTDQFTPSFRADRKDMFPIPGNDWFHVRQWAIGELDRRRRAVQKPRLHGQDPEVAPPFMSILVDNVAAIGRPSSTAHATRAASPDEYMKIGAVCLDLVD